VARKKWIVTIWLVSVAATLIFSAFDWFKTNEHVALWLEAVALVFIFGLDYVNRLDDSEKHAQQHKETLEQLELLGQHVEAAKKQADSSSESLRLLKVQGQEQQLRELWRSLLILDEIRVQIRFWVNLFDENRWNAVNEASKIMPVDSSAVFNQAARHSNELWNKVRETFRMVTNADYQLSRYYAQQNPAYRLPSFLEAAKGNLKDAEPKLTEIVGAFTAFEGAERNRHRQ